MGMGFLLHQGKNGIAAAVFFIHIVAGHGVTFPLQVKIVSIPPGDAGIAALYYHFSAFYGDEPPSRRFSWFFSGCEAHGNAWKNIYWAPVAPGFAITPVAVF